MQGDNATFAGGLAGPARHVTLETIDERVLSAQYFLHSGTVRLGSPILAKTAGS
jgi:hypothetical protein